MIWIVDSCDCIIEMDNGTWLGNARLVQKCKLHSTPQEAYDACKDLNMNPLYLNDLDALAAAKEATKKASK